MSQIEYEELKHGYKWGAATVTRLASDEETGWTITEIKTPKGGTQVYVTKTGKIRVFTPGKGEWFREEKDDDSNQ